MSAIIRRRLVKVRQPKTDILTTEPHHKPKEKGERLSRREKQKGRKWKGGEGKESTKFVNKMTSTAE